MLSLFLGKISLRLLNLVGSSGSTWPGHVSLSFDKNFIKKILKKNPQLKIILIAGTNGKTTTSKALSEILDRSGVKNIRNEAGANLMNGFSSTLVRHSSLLGKIDTQAIIFEVDENSLVGVLEQIEKPDGIILLNLFRDQLDRYGELNTIAEKWHLALKDLKKDTVIIANGDDPLIAYISSDINKKVKFITVEEKSKSEIKLSHAVDSITCPKCRNNLVFSRISYSHIGNYHCTNCKFKNPKSIWFDVTTKLMVSFNLYNLSSSILAATEIFNIRTEEALNTIKDFSPAFGRQELIKFNEKKALLLLSKNPTGFNESIKVVNQSNFSNILILLNDRIPDGRDISWIWDVDFELLNKKGVKVFAGGDRTYDLANRLFYAGINSDTYDDLEKVVNMALGNTNNDETLAVLPTYSAMLEVRKILTGRKIL